VVTQYKHREFKLFFYLQKLIKISNFMKLYEMYKETFFGDFFHYENENVGKKRDN